MNVLGEVLCKEKCGSSVSVTLVRLGGKSKEERKPVYLTDESSAFMFTNVLPGKHRLEVLCLSALLYFKIYGMVRLFLLVC